MINDGNPDPTIILLAKKMKNGVKNITKTLMGQAKIDAGLYDGALVKRGEGTLVMTEIIVTVVVQLSNKVLFMAF